MQDLGQCLLFRLNLHSNCAPKKGGIMLSGRTSRTNSYAGRFEIVFSSWKGEASALQSSIMGSPRYLLISFASRTIDIGFFMKQSDRISGNSLRNCSLKFSNAVKKHTLSCGSFINSFRQSSNPFICGISMSRSARSYLPASNIESASSGFENVSTTKFRYCRPTFIAKRMSLLSSTRRSLLGD